MYLNSTLKNINSNDISWVLIHNYPNCLNHPNLRNYSISPCINRGLGMGLINQFLKSKVMPMVYLKSLGAAKLSVLGCRGVLVSEAGLYPHLFTVC